MHAAGRQNCSVRPMHAKPFAAAWAERRGQLGSVSDLPERCRGALPASPDSGTRATRRPTTVLRAAIRLRELPQHIQARMPYGPDGSRPYCTALSSAVRLRRIVHEVDDQARVEGQRTSVSGQLVSFSALPNWPAGAQEICALTCRRNPTHQCGRFGIRIQTDLLAR